MQGRAPALISPAPLEIPSISLSQLQNRFSPNPTLTSTRLSTAHSTVLRPVIAAWAAPGWLPALGHHLVSTAKRECGSSPRAGMKRCLVARGVEHATCR